MLDIYVAAQHCAYKRINKNVKLYNFFPFTLQNAKTLRKTNFFSFENDIVFFNSDIKTVGAAEYWNH